MSMNLPQDVFKAKAGPRRAKRRWRLNVPEPEDHLQSLVDQGTIRGNELTPSGDIPAGQELEEVEYEECQFSAGSERLVGTVDNCETYKVLYTCDKVTEIWWLRVPPVRLSVNLEPLWCVWKAVLVCPDGSWYVVPSEIWSETGQYQPGVDTHAGDPPPSGHGPSHPLYLPPREVAIVTAGRGHRDGDILIEEDDFWELLPPYSIDKCWYTARWEKRTRIRRINVINNTSTSQVIDFVPELIEVRTERIPGCKDADYAQLSGGGG
jgi:hypothetical protein